MMTNRVGYQPKKSSIQPIFPIVRPERYKAEKNFSESAIFKKLIIRFLMDERIDKGIREEYRIEFLRAIRKDDEK